MGSSPLLRWGGPAAVLAPVLLGSAMISSKPGRTARNANP